MGNKNAVPPKHSQFKPGQSGNPAGLPKGYVRASTMYAELLKGKVPITEDGKVRKVTRHEAMMIKAMNDAMAAASANERTTARESILSRIEGKPVQPIGAAPDTEVTLTITNTENRL